MAVKFSNFQLGSTASDIDFVVGYKSTANVRIPIGLVTANTTYTVATAQSGLNETLTLTGSDASTDVITFTAGNDITLTDDGAGNGFTIASTASGETYDLNSTTDGANVDVNLTSTSGLDNSSVKLTPAGGLTITQTGNVITLDTSASGSGTVTNVDSAVTSIPGLTLVTTDQSTTPTVTLGLAASAGANEYLDGGTGEWTALPSAGGTSRLVTTDTGDGTTLIFTDITGSLTLPASNPEFNIDIYISGVYQAKASYTYTTATNGTITFASGGAPPNGAAIEYVTTT